ncbi:MAG: hypothetical protein AAFW47_01455 [Pseudomonadota bacterium]
MFEKFTSLFGRNLEDKRIMAEIVHSFEDRLAEADAEIAKVQLFIATAMSQDKTIKEKMSALSTRIESLEDKILKTLRDGDKAFAQTSATALALLSGEYEEIYRTRLEFHLELDRLKESLRWAEADLAEARGCETDLEKVAIIHKIFDDEQHSLSTSLADAERALKTLKICQREQSRHDGAADYLRWKTHASQDFNANLTLKHTPRLGEAADRVIERLASKQQNSACNAHH